MRTIWPILLFLFVTVTGTFSQTFVLGDVDASAYPTIRAPFYLFDAAGNRITNLSPSDFVVTEDGIRRDVTELRFCSSVQMRPLTVGIMVDTKYYIELAQAGTSRLINFLPMPPSELGITTMDQGVFIVQDLTKKKDRALEKSSTLQPAPGVDINRMFYDPLAGGVPFVSGRPNKKVLVLISDLHCPNLTIDEEKLYADAAREDISIYSVLLNANDYTGLFKRMAERTGGRVFERVKTVEEVENVFLQVGIEQASEPCELVWQSGPSCEVVRNVMVEVPRHKVIAKTSYVVAGDSIPRLEVSPSTLLFKGVEPGSTRELTATITAVNTSFTISDITSDNSRFSVVDYGGSPPRFTLQPNESRTIRVRFDPTDSGFTFGRVVVKTDICNGALFCAGGFPGKGPSTKTLKLTQPNGGETFFVRSDTVITWEGIPVDAPVALDYSIDAGSTWLPIVQNTNGLRYRWNVPNTPSDRCLARVSQLDPLTTDRDTLVIDSAAAAQYHDGIAFSPDGGRVAITAGWGTIAIWDVNDKKLIRYLSGPFARMNDVKWSPDGQHIAASSNENALYVWDASTGAIVHVLTGHSGSLNEVAWSPDGSKIATASLDQTVRIWSITDGSFITLRGHTSSVSSVSWSPDGSRLATSSLDVSMKIWSGADGALLRTVSPAPVALLDVAWSPTGRYVAVVGARGVGKIVDATVDTSFYLFGHFGDVPFVEWSPDGSRLTTASHDGTVRVWDGASGKNLLILSGGERACSATWSPDGSKILTTSAGFAVIWDAVTGIVIERLLFGHIEDVLYGAWSIDGSRVGTIGMNGMDGTARIWTFGGKVIQTDVSDSLWRIVVPRMEISVVDVDLHTVQLGLMRDSLVRAVLCNPGAAPLHILGMDVTSGDIADFMIPSGAGDFTLAPGECRDVTFEFMPTAVGLRQARVTLRTASGNYPDTIRVYGVGASPQMEMVSTVIDFKQVEVGAEKDTTVTVVLRNIGTSPVQVKNVMQRGPDMTQFEIINGGDPFTLAPGAEHAMSLRFKPRFIGRTSGRIAFDHDAVGSPSIATLFGEGIGGMVYIPDDSAAAGERLKLRLMLGGRAGKVQGSAREFSAVIGVDQSLLASDDPATPGTIDNGRRKIGVSGQWDGASDMLAELPVVALLGSTETSSMDVLSFEWKKSEGELFDVDVETESGTFRLLDICREGGDRLYDQNGVASALKVLPNPVRDRAEIYYSLAEDGVATIEVYDMLGERVERLLSEEQKGGEYRLEIETSGISSGIYTIVLRTPTQTLSTPLHIDR